MTKREVANYFINEPERAYKADKLTSEGYGQTIGAYHDEARKRRIDNPTQKWHFTVSYYEYIENKDAKPTYSSLKCPELLIWIAEAAGLDDSLIDSAIDYIKDFEETKGIVGTDKDVNTFKPIIDNLKEKLMIYDINRIICNASCWDNVLEKTKELK